ncbi:MAG: hypothetical protein JSW09_02535 [Pseudomonadota bacterium]|nr:MAG: hypothetical protein JSW09_02535 [Pseudomonadota bacterium]
MKEVSPRIACQSISFVAAVLMLTGCSTAQYMGDESSPFYDVPSGSRVVLKRELTIAPEEVAVYLQNGEVHPWSQINPQRPHCKFEVYERLATKQTVSPDEFIVTRVVRDEVHMVGFERIQVASMGLAMRVGGSDSRPTVITYATYLYLRSERQPHVFRLGCGHWDYPGKSSAEHLSINAMRQALGEVLSLTIAK